MFDKIRRFFKKENNPSIVLDKLSFTTENNMRSDTERLEQILFANHGHWLIPHRVTIVVNNKKTSTSDFYEQFFKTALQTNDFLPTDKNNLLRFRRWLPPVVISENKPDAQLSQPMSLKDQEITIPGDNDVTKDPEPTSYDIFVNPSALDLFLNLYIPVGDPRYYRIHKEVSFDLVKKMSEKTRMFFIRKRMRQGAEADGHLLQEFPEYILEFDRYGKIMTKEFSEIFRKMPKK